jgi:hypothetical protein
VVRFRLDQIAGEQYEILSLHFYLDKNFHFEIEKYLLMRSFLLISLDDFILVTSKINAQANITGVRYGFNNFPISSLVNKNGLPALPFAFPNPFP